MFIHLWKSRIFIVEKVCKTNKTAVSVDASASYSSRVISPVSLVCRVSLSPRQHDQLQSRSRPEDVIRPAFAVRKNSAPILEILSPFWPPASGTRTSHFLCEKRFLGTSERRGEKWEPPLLVGTWPVQTDFRYLHAGRVYPDDLAASMNLAFEISGLAFWSDSWSDGLLLYFS